MRKSIRQQSGTAAYKKRSERSGHSRNCPRRAASGSDRVLCRSCRIFSIYAVAIIRLEFAAQDDHVSINFAVTGR